MPPEKYDSLIEKRLLAEEKLNDIRVAVDIIVEERTRISERNPNEYDYIIALASLCILYPGPPPTKSKEYRLKVRKFRVDFLKGLGEDFNKQIALRNMITDTLRLSELDEIEFTDLNEFFRLRVKEA